MYPLQQSDKTAYLLSRDNNVVDLIAHKMAAVELNKNQNENGFISEIKEETLEIYVTKATEYLLFKQFKQCIETCDSGIAFAKVRDDTRQVYSTF